MNELEACTQQVDDAELAVTKTPSLCVLPECTRLIEL
ncbi:hypothetical protein COLO4_22343 [Corchorus olitorius]|uniref:Uncharacterized protein n=1 Tax=Corchorus olitorius TaxID=93759 RepID=A0A1R3IMT7_9ROSI|nr:hypothetical protein COLO4_22343 [Corchorus olitorius]